MKKRLLPILLLALLMGANECESPQPEDIGYCYGSNSTLSSIGNNASGLWNTIIGGTPSVDRRATVFVYMRGKGSCTGVVIGPRTVLTAAHCRNTSSYASHEAQLEPGHDDAANSWTAVGHLVHPDYLRYLGSGNVDLDGRLADLMLLYFDRDLPGPYVGDIYDARQTATCDGLIAQGWGQTEDVPKHPCPDGKSRCLREGPYEVTQEHQKQLYVRHALIDPLAICFGDSGGPLYAEMDDGSLQLAGITSTTGSIDCLRSSNHTKVSAFAQWVTDNTGGP